jgi:hydrogenase-1 operon protein HyaF
MPRPIPIPVVAFAEPGVEDAAPAYLPMPQGMATYQPPRLPEPEALAGHAGCVAVLQRALAALRRADAVHRIETIDLTALGAGDRRLLNQVLGEGEVAAQVRGPDGAQVQEAVFAGVWRVVRTTADGVAHDQLQIGALPPLLVDAALAAARQPAPPAPEGLGGVMNAPALLAELQDRSARWQAGDAPHVINLTLLPLTPDDSTLLDARLAVDRVLILSRGYGNCRIVGTRLPHTWRVTYFNSTDINILDTLEVGRVPEVACAAAEDLRDSAERLAEVLDWLQAE